MNSKMVIIIHKEIAARNDHETPQFISNFGSSLHTVVGLGLPFVHTDSSVQKFKWISDVR